MTSKRHQLDSINGNSANNMALLVPMGNLLIGLELAERIGAEAEVSCSQVGAWQPEGRRLLRRSKLGLLRRSKLLGGELRGGCNWRPLTRAGRCSLAHWGSLGAGWGGWPEDRSSLGDRLRCGTSSILRSRSRCSRWWGSGCLLRSGTRAGGSGKGVVEGDGTEGGSTEPGQLRHPQGGQGGNAEPGKLRPLLSLRNLRLLLLLHGSWFHCPVVDRLELRLHEALGCLAWLHLLQQGWPWRLHLLQLWLLHEPILTLADAMLEPWSRGSHSRPGSSGWSSHS